MGGCHDVKLLLAVLASTHRAFAEAGISPASPSRHGCLRLLTPQLSSSVRLQGGCGCSRHLRPQLSLAVRLRGGGASVIETAANIFTDIVPAGMLPVASGLAIASSSLPVTIGQPAAVALLILFALVAHRTLVLIAEAVEASGVAPSLSEVWASSPLLGGRSTVWLVDGSIALLTFGCCLYYACFIGDLLSAVAVALLPAGPDQVDAPVDAPLPWAHRRSTQIVGATVSVLLPLCFLRDLSLLAPFSLVGVFACIFCTAFIVVRMLDGSYQDGGRLDLALRAEGRATGQRVRPHGPWALRKQLPLINIISVAFLAHYNGAACASSASEPAPLSISEVESVDWLRLGGAQGCLSESRPGRLLVPNRPVRRAVWRGGGARPVGCCRRIYGGWHRRIR